MPGGAPPPSPFYPPVAYPFGPSPGYGHPGPLTIIERPVMPTRRSEISARTARPGARVPTELVQYNPNAGKTLSARRPTKPTFQEPTVESEDEESEEEEDSDDFSGEDEDEEEYEEESNPIAAHRKRLQTGTRNLDDTQMKRDAARRQADQQRQQQRQQMPPPNVAASVAAAAAAGGPKLSMRKANAPAPQITYGDRRPSQHNVDDDLRAAFRALNMGAAAGTSTIRRPSLTSSGGTKATSYSHPTGNTRVTVEGVNRNRRNSDMGSEDRARLEAMHARFQQSEDPRFRNPQQLPRASNPMDFNNIIEKAVRDKLNELHLPASQGAHSKLDLDAQMMAALAYQSRADKTAPRTRDELGELPQVALTAAALRRKAGLPSHTGSSRSKRSSDEGSRISAGHRITTGSDAGAVTVTGDEMKVRIDTTNGFEMEFEGRRVTLQPIGDGTTAELIIGGKRETAYFSSKGSTATRSQAGSRLTRAPSQRDRDSREPRERDVRERDKRDREREQRGQQRRDRDRARYDDDDDEEDRRTFRGGVGRRRADTYDSEYNRTGQMRRQDDYPRTPTYTRPPYSGYNGYAPQPYAPNYGAVNQADHVWGA
jgi:hypothetical protein